MQKRTWGEGGEAHGLVEHILEREEANVHVREGRQVPAHLHQRRGVQPHLIPQ